MFTIKTLHDDGRVTVTFDVDGKDQNIDRLPVHDAPSLLLALADYEKAYANGLQVEKQTIKHPDEVLALVGKPYGGVAAEEPTSKKKSAKP